MPQKQLAARARALRLGAVELSRLAGLDVNTVVDCLAGKTDPRTSTLRKLDRVITDQERSLLSYLAARHPDLVKPRAA